MQDGTFNQCSDLFLDSGGPGNYSSGENFVTTICSPTAGEAIVLNFNSFNENCSAYLNRKFSPMCWIKNTNGNLEKFFLIWW